MFDAVAIAAMYGLPVPAPPLATVPSPARVPLNKTHRPCYARHPEDRQPCWLTKWHYREHRDSRARSWVDRDGLEDLLTYKYDGGLGCAQHPEPVAAAA